jgi:hypothetical protein
MKNLLAVAVPAVVTVLWACGGGTQLTDGGTGGGSATGGGTAAGGGTSTGGGTASGGPHLSAPDCGTPDDAGTATDIYNDIVEGYGCNAGGCHGGEMYQHFVIQDAPSLRSVWINVSADERTGFNRVTPGNVDTSYVLYKLLNEQADAGGSGDQMPQGGPYLSDADVCKVLSWVKAGAP